MASRYKTNGLRFIVIPFTDTAFNLQALRRALKEAVGNDFSTNAKDATEPLIVLEQMTNHVAGDELKSLRNSAAIQKHFHFAFIVLGDEDVITRFQDVTNVRVTRSIDPRLAVLSTTLDVWVTGLEYASQNEELRSLANEIQRLFEGRGLGGIFHRYSKVKDENGYRLQLRSQ